MNNNQETTAIILTGDGYQLTITPEAEIQKLNLLNATAEVVRVTSNDESADAMVQSRRLAAMRIAVEKCRKEIKEPVNRIGKLIDATAKSFLAEIEDEEARIKRLVGDHAEAVAVLQREREAAERAAFEYAHKAREAAAETGSIADVIAAKQALSARLNASEALVEAKVAEGVRFAWDFEVVDADALHERTLGLTEVTVKRSAVLVWLKEWEEKGKDETEVMTFVKTCGLRAFKKPVVSSR
jgi:hypothetical protein